MKLGTALPITLLLLGCAIQDEEIPEEIVTEETGSEGKPCNKPLGRLDTPTGSTVEFCGSDDVVAVLETAPLHMRAYVNDLESHWRCPSDLYRHLAGDAAEVPPELLEDCRRRTESGRTSTTIVERPLVPPRPTLRSHFCSGSSGDDDFIDEKCSLAEGNAGFDGWYDSMWWCRTEPSTGTTRTASSQLGHNADKVRAIMASCSGTSNFKLQDYQGGWDTEIDTDVLSGYWIDGSVYTNLTDKNLRFLGDAYGSAWYRNAGMFGDFDWP